MTGVLKRNMEWMTPPTPHIANLPFLISLSFMESSMVKLRGLKPISPGTASVPSNMSTYEIRPRWEMNSTRPQKRKICHRPAVGTW